MTSGMERRTEPRIRYSWPVFFGYGHVGQLARGQVVDLSRSGLGFTVPTDDCPKAGSHVLMRFSYPADLSGNFQIDSYFDWAEVLRVEPGEAGHCRVGLRLVQPLPEDPGQGGELELANAAVC